MKTMYDTGIAYDADGNEISEHIIVDWDNNTAVVVFGDGDRIEYDSLETLFASCHVILLVCGETTKGGMNDLVADLREKLEQGEN